MLKKILLFAAIVLLIAVPTAGGTVEAGCNGYAGFCAAGPCGASNVSAGSGSLSNSGSSEQGMLVREELRNEKSSLQVNVSNQVGGNASVSDTDGRTDMYMDNARRCLQNMQREQSMTRERWQELDTNLCRLKEQFRLETRTEAREQIRDMFKACYQFVKQQQNTDEAMELLKDMISLEPGNLENYQELGRMVQSRGDAVPKVFCNGSELNTDVPVVIKDGRSLVPVRALSEALGATVQWNQAEQTVYINKGEEIMIQLQVDNRIALVNGREFTLDVPAYLDPAYSRVIVPLRFVSEIFKAEVNYYPVGQVITVNQ